MRALAIVGIILIHTSIPCLSFHLTRTSTLITSPQSQFFQQSFSSIRMSDKEDEDDYIDDANLGDWRKFRSTLVDSGISFESVEEGYMDTDVTDVDKSSSNSRSADIDASKGSSVDRPKSVSKANEELLNQQSKKLAKEYKDGVWAHESSITEVGGLVVRLSLEAEIYRSKDTLSIGKLLISRLERNENNSDNTSIFQKTIDSNKNDDDDLSCSLIVAQTLIWYRKAQLLIEEEMKKIAEKANGNGEIDPNGLPLESEDLLKLYIDCQQNWQEVCLVTERNEKDGRAITYTLNRPMAFKLSETLAKILLFGAQMNAATNGRVPVSETNRYTKFLLAFEKSCGVYIGGPDMQEQPAVLIHGVPDLEGSREVSPGTGLFVGGIDAAIDGVLNGLYKPLDFRFFIGCHKYKDGDLDFAINSNKYQPVACARSLALKQCIQLPKPLWHEVMEMCGGELREFSRLELMKRDDLKD
mmetsp:Transcript_51543/g.57569  ORF Transcript_51543/g.57569 Transcript_51543/m.57569 type:complete len:470 (+) Transcript_51543:80-1489(+)